MLKQRVLTAAILALLFVLALFFLPSFYFSLVTGLVVIFAAIEWTEISGYKQTKHKIFATLIMTVSMVWLYFNQQDHAYILLLIACALWCLVAVMLWIYRNGKLIDWPKPLRWSCGIWVLLPAWLALILLQEQAVELALVLFLLIWAADVGAYFCGRHWGKSRLAPAISPGKTIEGVIGGLVLTLITGLVCMMVLEIEMSLGLMIPWIMLLFALSVAGDLFESNWKRLNDMKDSGKVLPGHGGIMDRIDSFTAAAPAFALGWFLWLHPTVA